jgi:hypothetical protein
MISVFDTSSIVQSFKIIKFKIKFLKKLIWFLFCILKEYFKCFEIIKFKRNLKKIILISVLDTWSLVQSFKTIKFKWNLKSNYDFCFGYFKHGWKF